MRETVFKALVGSHNYNLADKNSDKDYKVFVLPTFEDLYNGVQYSKQTVGVEEDLDIHDIRKIVNLFYKSNINFIEVLFSNEVDVGKSLKPSQKKLVNEIFSLRDEIVKMNLPYLYNACGGMYYNKMKLMYKGTEGTQHLVDEYGYDTKQAQHAYRVINFIERFESLGFKDFKRAIAYDFTDRNFMMEIKRGFFTPDEFSNFITFYHDAKFKQLKEKYHSFSPNEELKEHLSELVVKIVKHGM